MSKSLPSSISYLWRETNINGAQVSIVRLVLSTCLFSQLFVREMPETVTSQLCTSNLLGCIFCNFHQPVQNVLLACASWECLDELTEYPLTIFDFLQWLVVWAVSETINAWNRIVDDCNKDIPSFHLHGLISVTS